MSRYIEVKKCPCIDHADRIYPKILLVCQLTNNELEKVQLMDGLNLVPSFKGDFPSDCPLKILPSSLSRGKEEPASA